MNPDLVRLLALLKLHEGYRKWPYRCTSGKLTIGYGRNLDDKGISDIELGQLERIGDLNPEDFGISKQGAELLLINDIREVWWECQRHIPAFKDLGDVRRAVLIDMAINMGMRRLLRFVKTLAFIGSGEYVEAADEMLRSDWAVQVKGRAIRLAQMMRSDKWPPEVLIREVS